MKVLMLGWEYPPHISGGLGTACEGLTVALSRLDVAVDFVVPHLFGGEQAAHMSLIDSARQRELLQAAQAETGQEVPTAQGAITTTRIPALLSPYWREEQFQEYLTTLESLERTGEGLSLEGLPREFREGLSAERGAIRGAQQRYGGDILSEVGRFTADVVATMGQREFDVIHAHDWMTFPAGVALQRLTGKPLIVHVHSLEYDRSGLSVNDQIHSIERLGVEAADAVIAVSHYTRSVIERQHGVSTRKIEIVHNGVYSREVVQSYRDADFAGKIVLFLGRITFQKGPEYFVEAAAKVIPHVPDAVFVMAGSGDLLPRVVSRARELGVESHFRFPGFLKGEQVEKIFSLADLYVMPSVSEPFGISALEAISFDTPVIISRQSGVSEVLNHALKFDYWDTDRMADLIINGLLHQELRADMVRMAREEVRRLRWDAAALKTTEVYRRLAAR
jgi:glycogen synthase